MPAHICTRTGPTLMSSCLYSKAHAECTRMALWVLRVLYSTLSELEGCARPRCLAGGFLHAKASGGAAVPLPVADGAGLTRAEQRRNREPVMDAVYDSYGRCPTLRVVTPGMGLLPTPTCPIRQIKCCRAFCMLHDARRKLHGML